jgi:methanogen extracellular protein (TIGR04279 family)/PGF-pre-PGF domain-containing protein
MRMRYLLILLMLLLILPASAEPLVKVKIFNSSYYESLTVLKPEDDGNWIKMIGGSEVPIPSIKLVYNGINETQYTKGDKTINITTNEIRENQDYVVDYPFTTHSVYYRDDEVKAEILGTSDLAGKTVYVYLVKTYPTQLKDALASAVDGNTQPIRDLLNNAVQNKSVILDANGDNKSISFGTLSPGDYVVIVLLNSSNAPNVTFVSATAFEVLEHKSSLNVDTSITRSSKDEVKYLEGTFEILGGSDNAKYTYVAVLIKKDAEATVKLTSSGTKATTNLTVEVGSASEEAKLVEGFKVAGVGLNNINATTVEDWLKAFPSDTVSFSVNRGVTGKTYNFKIQLQGLSDGDYYLYVAAWNTSNSSQRVVAFNWASVKITTVTPSPSHRPSGGGGGGGGGAVVALPPVAPAPVEATYSEAKTVYPNVEEKVQLPPTKAEATGVLAVVFKVRESMMLEIHVSKLKSLPSNVPKPPAKDVYGYIDITFRKYGTTIEVEPSGYIEFKVSKSWVTEKGYDPENIVLMKYHNGWKELKTELTNEDENYYYYKAETGSFSIFAIAVKPIKPTPTVTATTPPVVTPTVTTPVVTTTAITPTVTPTPPVQTVYYAVAIIVIVVVVIGIAIALRKRRR